MPRLGRFLCVDGLVSAETGGTVTLDLGDNQIRVNCCRLLEYDVELPGVPVACLVVKCQFVSQSDVPVEGLSGNEEIQELDTKLTSEESIPGDALLKRWLDYADIKCMMQIVAREVPQELSQGWAAWLPPPTLWAPRWQSKPQGPDADEVPSPSLLVSRPVVSREGTSQVEIRLGSDSCNNDLVVVDFGPRPVDLGRSSSSAVVSRFASEPMCGAGVGGGGARNGYHDAVYVWSVQWRGWFVRLVAM